MSRGPASGPAHTPHPQSEAAPGGGAGRYLGHAAER